MTCRCGRECKPASWPVNDEDGNVTWLPDRHGRPFRYRVVPGTATRDYPGDMAEPFCSPECSLAAH